MLSSSQIRDERLTPALSTEGQATRKRKTDQQFFEATTEMQIIKLKGRSVTNATAGIYIVKDNVAGGGEVAGVNEAAKLPPELLLKMREVLAMGVAKSIIAKSLAELQSEDSKEVAVGS